MQVHCCHGCRLTLRLQFLRRWEAGKRWVAPYLSLPLVSCTAAWRALRPGNASQQAAEQHGHLADYAAVSSHFRGPASFPGGSRRGGYHDLSDCSQSAHADREEDLHWQLPGMMHGSQHDFRPLTSFDGQREAGIAEDDGEHALAGAKCTTEQTGFWSHTKVE